MADLLRNNKKVIIPVVAVVAAALVGLVFFSSSDAFAQQSNGTGTNNLPYATSGAKPTINGTISVPQIIKNQIKVSFSDAAKTAGDAISGGTVVAGHLGVMQGYLVYTFNVLNTSNNQAYIVIVDPGNGQVLYQSPGHAIGGMGFGIGHGGMMRHHGPGMGMWKGYGNSAQQPPAPQSQSGLTGQGLETTQY